MNTAVIGGGYAGMAAAVTLAERGVPVTVFEAASELGGRARRVSYRETLLDNGLHILIGACRETLRMIHRVGGSRSFVRLPLDWHIHRTFRLRAAALPGPFHIAFGLLAARGASIGERLTAARFFRRMQRQRFRLARDMSVTALLALHRQPQAITRFLWEPLCVAALNTPPEQASAQVFLNVLRDSLGTSRADSDILLPRCDLTALFPEPAARYVMQRGGEVLVKHAVSRVMRCADGFHIEARGRRGPYAHVICALPPYRVSAVVNGLPGLRALCETVDRLHYQPISSVFLQYSAPVRLSSPMLGLADGIAHWLFDREALCGQRGLIAAVISASRPHRSLDQESLARRVHEEVGRAVGPLPPLLWHRVITEKRATFACTVGLERPPRRTALEGFYLAGDYTASEYPATIEAAVRSGIECARAVIESLHRAPHPPAECPRTDPAGIVAL